MPVRDRIVGPAIVLVEPQLGENIGAAARAMRNFGLTDLRLVAPRDGWPNPKAEAMASGADDVLASVRLFRDVVTAVEDLQTVFATTARVREFPRPSLTPRAAAVELLSRATGGARTGVLFGRESTGLRNSELEWAESLIHAPSVSDFRSLNLGQSVLLVAYEWRVASGDAPESILPLELSVGAARADVERLANQLEAELDKKGYFRPEEKRAASLSTLRNLLFRVRITEGEVRMLRGVVHALATESRKP